MEIKGKVVQLLPEQSGQGANGTWRKREFILEIPGTYPRKVCISMWGNNIDAFNIQEGEELTASIDIESREYNGRWYTNVKTWKVTREESQAGQPQDTSWPGPSDELKTETAAEDFDDLPF